MDDQAKLQGAENKRSEKAQKTGEGPHGHATRCSLSQEKALVLCSGGLDSSVLLAQTVERYGQDKVQALSIAYGQKHIREIESARKVCRHYQVPLTEIDLTPIFAQSNCSLLSHSSQSVPHESYAQQLDRGENGLVNTYVPYRNGLFISTAASIALSQACQVLLYGAHHDDWAGDAYPDCSPQFVESLARSIELGSGGILRLDAPFVMWNKAQIVAEGLRLKVPFELTWSCYEGGQKPCGQCGTCIDRQRAFEANNMKDPLLG